MAAGIILVGYGPWFAWIKFDQQLFSHALEGLQVDRIPEILNSLGPGLESAGRIWTDMKQWSLSLILLLFSTLALFFMRFKQAFMITTHPVSYDSF